MKTKNTKQKFFRGSRGAVFQKSPPCRRRQIYDVFIEPAGDENLFRVTWQDAENTRRESFTNSLSIPGEMLLTEWEKASNQLKIGKALFNFLNGGDDDNRYFPRALDKAIKGGKKLQVNLRTCEETADWPFELIAKDNEFLLFEHVHLVRRVSDRGIESNAAPVNDKIRLLFMAGDYLDEDSGLNYVKEEESIRKISLTHPIEMKVVDSGDLQGLQDSLESKYYDIVHLTAHAGIDEDGTPIFYMKDITDKNKKVKPGKLWDDALIENPPRLLFLSGCRSGQMRSIDGSTNVESYAHLMVEKYRIPVVLGWGRKINDTLAIYCAETFYQTLCQGQSIPDAVQQARHAMQLKFIEMQKESPNLDEPAWPMLRLYCNGTPLQSDIKEVRIQKQESGQAADIYLPYSRIKVLDEGFIGRRSQLQICMQALDDTNYDQLGVLLLGTGGIGKSCLAGKICKRFPDHAVIVLEGKLDDISLETILQKVFKDTGDEQGLKKLEGKTAMTDKLADICATCFKEKNYLILLDGVEQNLEKTESGWPGELVTHASELLYTLLYYLTYSGKMSKIVVTSRFSFTLPGHGGRLLEERLQKVWLTSFRELELDRKVRELKHIGNCKNSSIKDLLVNAGCGNPLLLEQIDRTAGQIPADDTVPLEAEVKKIREDFIQELGLYELYRQCSEPLRRILECLSIYRAPLAEDHIRQYETTITGFPQWKELLQEGMNLGLVEYDQSESAYRLTPLLNEKLKAQ